MQNQCVYPKIALFLFIIFLISCSFFFIYEHVHRRWPKEIKRSIYKLFITDYYQPATIIKSKFVQWSLKTRYFLYERVRKGEKIIKIYVFTENTNYILIFNWKVIGWLNYICDVVWKQRLMNCHNTSQNLLYDTFC